MSTSVRSASPQHSTSNAPGSSSIRPVVTAPPWARHEPPSPDLETMPISDLGLRATASVTSGSVAHHGPSTSSATSFRSDDTTQPTDWRRWRLPQMITQLRRGSGGSPTRQGPSRLSEEADGQFLQQQQPLSQEPVQSSDPTRPPESTTSYFPHVRERDRDGPSNGRARQLRLQIPHGHSFTLAQSKTPGWATPWAPSNQAHRASRSRSTIPDDSDRIELSSEKDPAHMSTLKRHRRTLRNYILTNAYVPLMCRIANLSFTAATLGVAVRLRRTEISHNILGAIGISPLLAIIFSPLTLTHVLLAIYLEYFGRPLGLWRTASKLAHTLLEVFFICLWSGSVSLAFNDYYTSPLLCVAPTENSWWNTLPPQTTPLPGDHGRHEGGVADELCDEQLVIVCLEFIGLILYNVSLVITIFRIIEKVKTTTTAARSYV